MKLLPILLAAGALSCGFAANALELNPYLGAEFKAWGTDNDNRVFNSFPNNFKAGNYFIGSHFHENFAFEIGYTQSGNRSKIKTWTNTETLAGPFTPGVADTTNVKARLSSWNFNLNGFYPLMDDLDLMGVLGVSSVKPRVTTVYTDNAPVSTGGTIASTFTTQGRSSFAYRVGAGLKYMFNHSWGTRAYVNWENNSNIKVRSTIAYNGVAATTPFSVDQKPWNNDVSFSLGLFYGW